jgi:cobalamin synthase
MYIALINSWEWAWGVLFMLWVIPDIRRKTTFFIEEISEYKSPTLYWIIVVTWILLSIYSFSTVIVDYNQFYY